MSKDLPVELKKDNIFKRIFNNIKRLLFNKKNNNVMVESTPIIDEKINFTDFYKVENLEHVNASIIRDINNKNKIEEIIQIIEKNPDTLDKLDIPKLEIIDNYYKNKVLEYKNKIARLS